MELEKVNVEELEKILDVTRSLHDMELKDIKKLKLAPHYILVFQIDTLGEREYPSIWLMETRHSTYFSVGGIKTKVMTKNSYFPTLLEAYHMVRTIDQLGADLNQVYRAAVEWKLHNETTLQDALGEDPIATFLEMMRMQQVEGAEIRTHPMCMNGAPLLKMVWQKLEDRLKNVDAQMSAEARHAMVKAAKEEFASMLYGFPSGRYNKGA